MNQSVVQIENNDKLLSKSQKEFNRLIKKIEKTEQDLIEYKKAITRIQGQVQRDMAPLRRQYAEQLAQLVKIMDRAFDSDFFKKAEKKKLSDWIVKNTFSLIDDFGMDDFKAIYDKHDEDGFDATNQMANEEIGQSMKEMLQSMFGITLDDDVDVSSPELLEAQIKAKMAEKQMDFDQQHQERQAQRPKTKKQTEREDKQKLEITNITKAVRTIYMDLVKAFHPDRETDEAEKARKTEIMHRITEAYEKNDLLALFKLQLEFNRIDRNHLDRLAEDQLKYYNKILKQQAAELEQELEQLQMALQAMSGRQSYYMSSPSQIELQLLSDIKALKRDIKNLQKESRQLQDNDVMRLWLKNYKIEKSRDSFDDMFEMIF